MTKRKWVPQPLAADDPRHGTCNGYANYKCRCQPCRDAWAKWCGEAILRRNDRLAADPNIVEHGAPSTYSNYRCRCKPCRDAWAAYIRERRQAS